MRWTILSLVFFHGLHLGLYEERHPSGFFFVVVFPDCFVPLWQDWYTAPEGINHTFNIGEMHGDEAEMQMLHC